MSDAREAAWKAFDECWKRNGQPSNCLGNALDAYDKAQWQPIETAPLKHMFGCDLWVPKRGRVVNCTYSTAFDPPQWCEPSGYEGGYQTCCKVEGVTHWMSLPQPPGDEG